MIETREQLDAIKKSCYSMVTKSAGISAGTAIIPIPGLDIGSDVAILIPAYSRDSPENEDGEWFSLVESGCSCQNTIQEDHSPWVKAYPPGRPRATALSVSS